MNRHKVQTSLIALLLTAQLWFGAAEPTTAKIEPGFEGSVRSICLDSTTKAHPKKDSLVVVLADDRFATPGSALLQVVYEPESFNSGSKGKMSAKATQISTGGSETKLGNLSGKQAAASAPIQEDLPIDVGLEAGDLVVVDLKFSKFDKLRGKECFKVFVMVVPAE